MMVMILFILRRVELFWEFGLDVVDDDDDEVNWNEIIIFSICFFFVAM
jgi:hypothetical protein